MHFLKILGAWQLLDIDHAAPLFRRQGNPSLLWRRRIPRCPSNDTSPTTHRAEFNSPHVPPESWHARFLQPHLSRIPFGSLKVWSKKNKAFVACVHYITIIIIIYLHYHRTLRLRGELGISRWHRFLPSSRSSVDDEELRVDAQLVQETAAETAICSPADTQMACFQKNLDWRMELAPFTEILYFECLTVQPLFSSRDWETKSSNVQYMLYIMSSHNTIDLMQWRN